MQVAPRKLLDRVHDATRLKHYVCSTEQTCGQWPRRFIAQFRFTSMGRNRIMARRGTACHVRGAPRILDEIEQVLAIKETASLPSWRSPCSSRGDLTTWHGRTRARRCW